MEESQLVMMVMEKLREGNRVVGRVCDFGEKVELDSERG